MEHRTYELEPGFRTLAAMLIAEDLLLLAYEDATGKPERGVTNLDHPLAAALLIELALRDVIELRQPDGGDRRAPGALVLRDDREEVAPGHPALDLAAGVLGEQTGTRPKDAIGNLAGKNPSGTLLDELGRRGILRKDEGKVLGLFPVTHWPAEDSRHEERTRGALREVLVDGRRPDERTGALVSLLAGMSLIPALVEPAEKKAAEARAKEIAEGNWAAEAVHRAVEEITAVAMVTLFVPTIIAGTS
jgi:hypothetical protein